MHENDFEKQVKDLMEGYGLSPSTSVWEKVKLRIAKRKRRVWPFALLFLCAVTGGYFMYHYAAATKAVATSQQKNVNSNIEKNLPAATPEQLNDNIKNNQPVTVQNNKPANAEKLNEHDKSENTKNILNQPNKSSFTPGTLNSNRIHNHAFIRNKKEGIKTNSEQKEAEILMAETDHPAQEKINKDSLQQPQDLAFNKNKSSTETDISTENNTQQDITLNNRDSALTIPNDSTPINRNELALKAADSLINQTIHNNKKPAAGSKLKAGKSSAFKWQYGVMALYGAGNTSKNLFQLHLSNEKSISSNLNAGGPTTSRDTTAALSHAFDYNNAFKAGLNVQRRINKNSFINTGITYTQLSNKAHVTRRIEYIANSPVTSADITYSPQSYSLASFSSASSATQTVTSIYRFIEVPVQWQQNFINKKKLSFSYNAGLSVMQLLSYKALVYDEPNNVYFFKNNVLRPIQLQAGAGLNMHISLSSKYTLIVGPQLNYSLTKTLKSNDYGKYHYIVYGLQANIMMHK